MKLQKAIKMISKKHIRQYLFKHRHHAFNANFLLLLLFTLFSFGATSQSTMSINAILDSIQANNPAMKMYDADIRSMDEAARGARSWMPPQVGTGFFATPYNTSLWRSQTKVADGSLSKIPGMGQYTVSVEQMIPNKKELDANEKYMKTMSSVSKETKKATLNELYAAAKKSYYDWLVTEKKLKVLDENERVLNFMIQSAELRYKNNIGKLDAYYKAKAALSSIANQRVVLQNEIKQQQIMLNTLMNRDKEKEFDIDSSYAIKNYTRADTSYFLQGRSDIKAIERNINLTYLKQDLERTKLKPQFGVGYENMFGFGGTPMQYTLMATVKLPFAAWSSKMYKANIVSLKWKAESFRQQQQMVLNEAFGQAQSATTAIGNKKKQLDLYLNNIIPALQKNYQTMQLGYEQNTEELFTLFDAWETLNMTQLEYLDQLFELLNMQVELDKVLEQK